MSLDLLKKPDTLRWFVYTPLAIVTLITLTPIVLSSPFNGFRIKDPLIPIDQIHHGGPPRDGIPSIDKPVFISARKADNLNPTDRVLGIELNNIKKAYPIKILNWHEIVNDRFDHQHLVISYCPLCGTGMAFKSDASSFGVSGLLYNSDMLLYDRKTKSLWSQIMAQAISGPLKGERLTPLAIEHTSWEDWSNRHPDTQVLSQKTGFKRSYSRSPYGHYETNAAIHFPVNNQSRRYHPKEKVIGIHINGIYKAYPFVELDKSGTQVINDQLGTTGIRIEFNAEHRTGIVKHDTGETLPSLISYWFAWYAFHPETEIYVAR